MTSVSAGPGRIASVCTPVEDESDERDRGERCGSAEAKPAVVDDLFHNGWLEAGLLAVILVGNDVFSLLAVGLLVGATIRREKLGDS